MCVCTVYVYVYVYVYVCIYTYAIQKMLLSIKTLYDFIFYLFCRPTVYTMLF